MKCPTCASEGAECLFSTAACVNERCRNFSAGLARRREEEARAARRDDEDRSDYDDRYQFGPF